MMWRILGCEFEVDKDGNEYSEKVDSLASAMRKMANDASFIVKYDLQIDDRTYIEQVETFSYKETAQLSEQQILELIEQRIKIKYK
ncbi:MAG: hypothetical protein ABI891_03045 [Acidobacteriota bacterium]